jgi:plastocyanin
MRALLAVVSTAILSALLVSCGGGSTGPSGGGGPAADVTIRDFTFTPSAVTIKAGETVRWTNNGPSAHTTTSDGGVWDSGTLSPTSGGGGGGYSMSASMSGSATGTSFQFTFMQAGMYPYHCSIHPPAQFPGFTGTVTVTP